ncbi:MAG: A24 family peptidase C-terminal domain-containing protein [Thermoprotei archaeon]
MDLFLIYPVQIAYTLVMLVVTSVFDIKYREVPNKLWIPFLPLAIFTYLEWPYVNPIVFVYSVAVSVVLLLVMAKAGLMGGADVVLILLLGLGNPIVLPPLFPRLSLLGGEAITVVIYTSVSIVLWGLVNALRNARDVSSLSGGSKWVIAFSGKKMTVGEFLKSRFYFPLTEIDESGNVRLRTHFKVEEDDAYWRKRFEVLLRRGVVREDTEIWVAWGVPVIPFFLIGYVVSLVVGLPL